MMRKVHSKDKAKIAVSKTINAIRKIYIELIIGLLTGLGSLFIFLKITDRIINEKLLSFDQALIDYIISFRTVQLTEIMKVITFFGGEIFIGNAIILTVFLLFRKHKKDAVVFGFILLAGIFINLLIKIIIHRQRPEFIALIQEQTFSFPSGHSMNSSVFFLCLTYFIFKNLRNRTLGIILTILSGALVLLIGISRIYLGVHYPSDVIGGFAAGLLWFVVILLFEKSILFFRLFKKSEVKHKY